MKRSRIVMVAGGLALLAATRLPAAVSVYLSPEELTARTPLIVEATVTDKRSGLDPQSAALRTYVTLAVDQVHRGPQGLSELVVREPGGSWGDLVHEVDAVPEYRVGERVFAYLEPAADGALRTVGMFFGKFHLAEESPRGPLLAVRDLEGQGTILGRSAREERVSRADLAALAAALPLREKRPTPAGPAWRAHPPEWTRLRWDSPFGSPPVSSTTPTASGIDIAVRQPLRDTANFIPLDPSHPTRWSLPDAGLPVTIHIEPGGNPLNDDHAAVEQILRAMQAWTDVPESRLSLQAGNTNYGYTQVQPSPASNYNGINIVLFGDPYDDISDPTGCGGVLAMGGYWRVASGGTFVNNVAFNNALQLYVIFNNDFECVLGDADNLAEVATHEIGHGLGFGHSAVPDAIMRSFAHGNRGPRLGSDDIDAAHCHYPHTLALMRPNGDEAWAAGSVERLEWSVTSEDGPDSGWVDLEYSVDGGQTWNPIATGVASAGSYDWTVPDDPSSATRVRVARPTRGMIGAPYPAGWCSGDASDASLSLLPPAPPARTGLRLDKNGPLLHLSWSASDSTTPGDYAVHEGILPALRAGIREPTALTCVSGVDLEQDLPTPPDSRYYLVAACAGAVVSSLRPDRPQPFGPCGNEPASSCMP